MNGELAQKKTKRNQVCKRLCLYSGYFLKRTFLHIAHWNELWMTVILIRTKRGSRNASMRTWKQSMGTQEAKQEAPCLALTGRKTFISNASSDSNPQRHWLCSYLKRTTAYRTPTSNTKLVRLLWTSTEEQETKEENKNLWRVKHCWRAEHQVGTELQKTRYISLGSYSSAFGNPLGRSEGRNRHGKHLTEKVCVPMSSFWENIADFWDIERI